MPMIEAESIRLGLFCALGVRKADDRKSQKIL
jgi:hypothetical protein